MLLLDTRCFRIKIENASFERTKRAMGNDTEFDIEIDYVLAKRANTVRTIMPMKKTK